MASSPTATTIAAAAARRAVPWAEAWATGKTGWDLGGVTPALAQLLRSAPDGVELPETGLALVPGAGTGYDVAAIASSAPGLSVYGMDLVEEAKSRFEAHMASLDSAAPANASYLLGDFFALGTPDSPLGDTIAPGSVDLVYDYTFSCAIDLEDRAAWADTYARILKPDGVLVVLVFPIRDLGILDGGGPHQITPAQVHDLLEPVGFTAVHEAPVPASVTGDPMRAGLEVMTVWRRQ